MGTNQLAVKAFTLLALAHNAVASMVGQRHYLAKRGTEPNMPYDFNTIKTCTGWYDNYEGFTCEDIRDWRYAISPEDFTRWNPSITLDCGNWQELSYCVQVRSEMTTVSSSSALATSTTSAASSHTPMTHALLGWTSLGCYKAGRKLKSPSSTVDSRQLAPKSCGAACYADGLKYAGLQAGKECWCNDYVGNEWASDQEDCNIPCPGDASQTCGGASVLNFFKAKLDDALPPGPIPSGEPTSSTTMISNTATKTSSPAESATPSWQAVGCYKDLYPASDHTLKTWGGMNYDTMTVTGCHATCAKGGYLFSGVENDRECWFGNEVSSPEVNVPVAENDCNTPCTGDARQTCGAGARIYMYKYVVPSVPRVSLGCYGEEYPRILRYDVQVPGSSATNNSRQNCIDTCDRAGYVYAGVQFGAECYCDNVIHEPGKLAPDGAVGWYVLLLFSFFPLSV
ncbi:putative CFEM domain-containing protein [Colletotrichum sublineola]|uniref:Putative CFEM domain-containing protein n=1 Tax=Colletotrichum sublineola TaxID=1173701 RepID=A0A066XLE7_COLSU|nr:putative CFEM domain-containing protein [Colletotrichum sublineola]